jgi:hypothetical protein
MGRPIKYATEELRKEAQDLCKKKWAEDNKEYAKSYYQKNKERIRIERKSYREKNADKLQEYFENFRKKNADRRSAESRAYYWKNIEKVKIRNKNHYQKTKPQRNKYLKERRNKDPHFSISISLRSGLNKAIKKANASKCLSASTLIGMPIADFKIYIESLFEPGMSWENRSEWHLDHKKPCAAFDLTNIGQQKKCFHWSNFQPLWKKDNNSKNSFYEGKRHTYKMLALNRGAITLSDNT